MSDVLVEPEVSDPEAETEEPEVAHIVKKSDQMEGYVNGKVIEALCGKRWVPTHTPDNLPVCEKCKVIARSIILSGSN